jgi:hypothetical protein
MRRKHVLVVLLMIMMQVVKNKVVAEKAGYLPNLEP